MTRLKYTILSPLKRRVTIRRHSFKGYELVRGGKEVISDAPMHDLAEAEKFAKIYCDYWGDDYGGVEQASDMGRKPWAK